VPVWWDDASVCVICVPEGSASSASQAVAVDGGPELAASGGALVAGASL